MGRDIWGKGVGDKQRRAGDLPLEPCERRSERGGPGSKRVEIELLHAIGDPT